MLELTSTDNVAVSLLAVGVLLWAMAPVFEALAGDRGALSALIAGYALLLSSTTLSFLAETHIATHYLSISVLGWGIGTYIAFLATPEGKPPKFYSSDRHCAPTLIHGTPKHYSDHKWKIRARLTVDFDVVPTSCSLSVSVWASGRAYYGLYFTKESFPLQPSVDVVCIEIADGSCRALGQITGEIERNESPLLLRVDHAISESSDELNVRTTITAAVAASGGSLGASYVAGASVGLPNAALSFQVPMGTFFWRCNASA